MRIYGKRDRFNISNDEKIFLRSVLLQDDSSATVQSQVVSGSVYVRRLDFLFPSVAENFVTIFHTIYIKVIRKF